MISRIAKLMRKSVPIAADAGLLSASGATVPSAVYGYQPGCIFQDTTNGAIYVNEGTLASCTFALLSALTAAQEALLGATAGTATASKAVILDSDGAISSGTIVLADMPCGTGISAGSGTICESRVSKVGGLFKTEMFIDLTGLHGGDAVGDIIGVDGGTANCHIGQITAAKNGTIFFGRITCLETPAGGDPDVDFYGSADEATGAQDAALATITGEAILLNHGDWTGAIATPVALTAFPDADGYMYMSQGAATDVAYSAGIFLIEMWGK